MRSKFVNLQLNSASSPERVSLRVCFFSDLQIFSLRGHSFIQTESFEKKSKIPRFREKSKDLRKNTKRSRKQKIQKNQKN